MRYEYNGEVYDDYGDLEPYMMAIAIYKAIHNSAELCSYEESRLLLAFWTHAMDLTRAERDDVIELVYESGARTYEHLFENWVQDHLDTIVEEYDIGLTRLDE